MFSTDQQKKLQIILAGTEIMPPEVAAVSSADGRRRLVLVGDPGAEFPATPAQAVVLRALGRRQAAVTGRPALNLRILAELLETCTSEGEGIHFFGHSESEGQEAQDQAQDKQHTHLQDHLA
jgi:hypothetical protein